MLGLFNAREDLKKALGKISGKTIELDTYIDPHPTLSGLFIDWVPVKNDPKFAIQGIYVEHYAKAGVPIVIFDRHLRMNHTEYSWLRKFNITFCEPVISFRTGFEWMPLWVEYPLVFKRDSEKRPYILTGTLDNATLEQFDDYYKRAAELLPSKCVSYKITENDIYDSKIEELKRLGIQKLDQIDYSKAYSTILIGCFNDYKYGRLPDNFFDIMRSGCLPLLPIEHRFYCSMFDEYVISDRYDLQFLLTLSENLGSVLIADIAENMVTRYPEFNISNTVERIKEWLL